MKKTLKTPLALLIVVTMIQAGLPMIALADKTTDEVVYNLGNREVIVGWGSEQEDAENWANGLFDENGNFEIQLEENAFFPYEVQFKMAGKTTVKWFDTPDSKVTIGRHVFSVATEQIDSSKIQQIGVWIDDEYIAAKPEPKKFTNPEVQAMSLLPLTEVYLSIDLNGFLPSELKEVTLSTLLTCSGIAGGPSAVYARMFRDDSFVILKDGSAIMDLSGAFPESKYRNVQLIVGSSKQLDYNNVRYIISFDLPTYERLFEFDVRDIETDEEIFFREDIWKGFFGSKWDESQSERIAQYSLEVPKEDEFVNLHITKTSEYDGIDVAIYKGFFDSPEDASSNASITFLETFVEFDAALVPLTAVITKNGETWVYKFHLRCNSLQDVFSDIRAIEFNDIAYQDDFGERNTGIGLNVINKRIYNNIPTTVVIHLEPGYSTNDEYYIGLSYPNLNFDVKSAVASGIDASLDIQRQLFPTNMSQPEAGYKAIYKDGVDFIVFAETDSGEPLVFPFTVIVTDKPIDDDFSFTHQEDTNFRVNGSEGYSNSNQNAYVMSPNADSLYSNYDGAYQTVLLLDDQADLSRLRPTFWTNPGIKMYVGTEQVSGLSERDFSKGPVLYTARALDGRNVKNYFVTFAKAKRGCAELFVNGPDKREVFLDEAYENYHDILIANLGDEPLTGLRVDWIEAPENMRIDDYWTVGPGNDTLAGFTVVKDPKIEYGEIPNVAKIRLIPTGEGTARGKLKISSANGGERIVELVKAADNPKIVTESLSDAVKYVPYSFMIQSNNIYEWNKVTFKQVGGNLPAGVNLLPNGELYGVPTEAGTFNFSVQMTNDYEYFVDSNTQYTLVVNDNTDKNVDDQTDDGYTITTYIKNMTSFYDQDLVIEGAFGEFVDLWLNGDRLVRGEDYTAEDGSTKITVRSQTFKDKGVNGTNTIAGEYRDSNHELKKAAQNFKQSSNTSEKTTSSGGSHVNATQTQPATIEQPQVPLSDDSYAGTSDFWDVNAGAWYYPDVKWAYDNKVMVGISNSQFAPNIPATQGMFLTVLARLAGIDTDEYADAIVPGMAEYAWYTNFVKWAYEKGLLEGKEVDPDRGISREDVGVILFRYLKYLGVNYIIDDDFIIFKDESSISEESMEALQTLFKLGIFKGIGDNKIDPRRAITRAELAALLHRMDTIII